MSPVQNQSKTQGGVQKSSILGGAESTIGSGRSNGINNSSASQAERRGFDPRLPLHLINHLQPPSGVLSPKPVQNLPEVSR